MFERELNQVALESGYQDAEARNLRSLGHAAYEADLARRDH